MAETNDSTKAADPVVDYQDAALALQAMQLASSGGLAGAVSKASDLVKLYKNNEDLFKKLFGWGKLLVGLFHHNNNGGSVRVPQLPAPPAEINLAPAPAPPPAAALAAITGLKFTGMFIELGGHGDPNDAANPYNIVRKDEFDKIAVKDGNAVPIKSQIHYDFSPFDANGAKLEKGDPRFDAVAQDRRPLVKTRLRIDGTVVEHDGDGSIFELHSFDDDNGCTPVVKFVGDGRHTVEAQAFIPAGAVGNRDEIASDWSKPVTGAHTTTIGAVPEADSGEAGGGGKGKKKDK